MSTSIPSAAALPSCLSPATILCENSPTPTWINFLKDEVVPLLKERENNAVVYHSPVGFKNANARVNYINHLKNVMEEVPGNEQEELKELIDKDFGLLELATNAGEMKKKDRNIVYCSQHL